MNALRSGLPEYFGMQVIALLRHRLVFFCRNAISIRVCVVANACHLPGDFHTGLACLNDEAVLIDLFSDNGLGMSPEVIENIFIPFFSTKKNGSGIGLSLCKQILLLHKGNIQVQSVEGTGSAFILHF